jgi:hypothetical protein
VRFVWEAEHTTPASVPLMIYRRIGLFKLVHRPNCVGMESIGSLGAVHKRLRISRVHRMWILGQCEGCRPCDDSQLLSVMVKGRQTGPCCDGGLRLATTTSYRSGRDSESTCLFTSRLPAGGPLPAPSRRPPRFGETGPPRPSVPR